MQWKTFTFASPLLKHPFLNGAFSHVKTHSLDAATTLFEAAITR